MIKTTWLQVFFDIKEGTIPEETKFLYRDDIYTYTKGQIRNNTNDKITFKLSDVFDTCYILQEMTFSILLYFEINQERN